MSHFENRLGRRRRIRAGDETFVSVLHHIQHLVICAFA